MAGGATTVGGGGDTTETEFRETFAQWLVEFKAVFVEFHLSKNTSFNPNQFDEVLGARIVLCPDEIYCPNGKPQVNGRAREAKNEWIEEKNLIIPQIELHADSWRAIKNKRKKLKLAIHEYLGLLEQKYSNDSRFEFTDKKGIKRNIFDDSDIEDVVDANKYNLSTLLSEAPGLFLGATDLDKYISNFEKTANQTNQDLLEQQGWTYREWDQHYCYPGKESARRFMELGGYVDQRTKDSLTMLMAAAIHQCQEYVGYLLYNKANPFEKFQGDGSHALILAVLVDRPLKGGSFEIVNNLLSHGGAALAHESCYLYKHGRKSGERFRAIDVVNAAIDMVGKVADETKKRALYQQDPAASQKNFEPFDLVTWQSLQRILSF